MMRKQTDQNAERINQTSSKTALSIGTNQHMMLIEHLLSQLKEDYDIVSAILFAQSVMLSPQIITARDIEWIFRNFYSTFLSDLSLFPKQESLTNSTNENY
jgi:phospholipid N-methyltransferase